MIFFRNTDYETPEPLLHEPIDELHRAAELAKAINSNYVDLVGNVFSEALTIAKWNRSLWAKRIIEELVHFQCSDCCEFEILMDCLRLSNGFISADHAQRLWLQAQRFSTGKTRERLAWLLADFGENCEQTRRTIANICKSPLPSRRMGPIADSRLRPIRKSRMRTQWQDDPEFADYEYVDGNPDHISIRGLELRSGDIGIVELNYPGDGILGSFLEDAGLAPHAMLFFTRRVKTSKGATLFQPSLFEIFEEGWRCIPLSTGLSRCFSWYSEWLRPPNLPSNIGEEFSRILETLGPIAFDFKARRAPLFGDFSGWEQPSASCTNLVRLPFEMIGITLPYSTSKIHAGAIRNLERMGLCEVRDVYTPTNILNQSGFEHVGIVDNGMPEWSIAQAMVVGRPELAHTFGGYFCQRTLVVENLPDWKSIQHWRSAWEATKIRIAQTSGMLSTFACTLASFDKNVVPRSASPSLIAFYLRSAMESGHIVSKLVAPHIHEMIHKKNCSTVQQIRSNEHLEKMIGKAVEASSLEREGWYAR